MTCPFPARGGAFFDSFDTEMDMKKQQTTTLQEQFGMAPVFPLIMKMALPSVAAQLVNLLYSIVDRIFVGRIPGAGTLALAGVGIVNTPIILISAFAMLAGGGAAPLASIALGKGEKERAEKILGNCFFLLVVFAILLMLPGYLFLRPILFAVGASKDTIGYAQAYFSVYLAGTFFVMVNTGLSSFLNVQGQPLRAMASVLVGAAMNMGLDPLLMFGLGMGVTGAALATVVSQAVSAFFILSYLFSKRATLRVIPARLHPDRGIIGSICAHGISPFVKSSTESLVGFVLNSGLRSFGDIYVSALTIMQTAMQIISIPLQGFTQGANPVISYNFGRRDAGRVKQGAKVMFGVMFTWNLVLTLFFILCPGLVASLFTEDAELIACVKQVMPVFLLGMTIFGAQRASQNMFVSLNQPKVSLFIALLRKVILLVPLALILPKFFGVMGIFAAEAVADGTAAICCILIFLNRFPKILRSMQEA